MTVEKLNALLEGVSDAVTTGVLGPRLMTALVPVYATSAALVAWVMTRSTQEGASANLRLVARQGMGGLELERLRGSASFLSATRDGQPRRVAGAALALEGASGEVLLVPLSAQGRSVGLLMVVARDEPFWEDAATVEALQRGLGLALGNALLAEEVERAAGALHDAGAQMFQSERLAVLGMLASGIAHEINNPSSFVITNLSVMESYIRAILDFLDLVEAEVAGSAHEGPLRAGRERLDLDYVRDDLPALLARSLQGMGRINNIVRGLRLFSHDGGDDLDELDLGELIDSAVALTRAEAKGTRIVCEYEPGLPRVRSSRSRLTQVLLNLMLNAHHAIEDHDPPTRRIAVRARSADASSVLIEVEDTGGGIKPEHVERIFEPFFTTKSAGQGTGLGLALSRDIVERLGGVIRVESRQGVGSTFTIRLPVRSPGSGG